MVCTVAAPPPTTLKRHAAAEPSASPVPPKIGKVSVDHALVASVLFAELKVAQQMDGKVHLNDSGRRLFREFLGVAAATASSIKTDADLLAAADRELLRQELRLADGLETDRPMAVRVLMEKAACEDNPPNPSVRTLANEVRQIIAKVERDGTIVVDSVARLIELEKTIGTQFGCALSRGTRVLLRRLVRANNHQLLSDRALLTSASEELKRVAHAASKQREIAANGIRDDAMSSKMQNMVRELVSSKSVDAGKVSQILFCQLVLMHCSGRKMAQSTRSFLRGPFLQMSDDQPVTDDRLLLLAARRLPLCANLVRSLASGGSAEYDFVELYVQTQVLLQTIEEDDQLDLETVARLYDTSARLYESTKYGFMAEPTQKFLLGFVNKLPMEVEHLLKSTLRELNRRTLNNRRQRRYRMRRNVQREAEEAASAAATAREAASASGAAAAAASRSGYSSSFVPSTPSPTLSSMSSRSSTDDVVLVVDDEDDLQRGAEIELSSTMYDPEDVRLATRASSVEEEEAIAAAAAPSPSVLDEEEEEEQVAEEEIIAP